jgi:DHA3 family tetracycline resistance protein-like MFS transporter
MVFNINSLYRVRVAMLDPLQLVLLGTVLELSIFIFEIPTGIVADGYSRRLSIIIGVFLMAGGFLLEGFIPRFFPIMAAQFLWGTGATCTSVALQAWITDEIGEKNAAAALLKGAQFSQLGAMAGILASTLLALGKLNLPIQVSGVSMIILGIFLIMVMPETGFTSTFQENRSGWQNMAVTFRRGLGMVKRRPALADILWIGFFFGFFSEGFDRLWVAYLNENFLFPFFSAVIWMGIIQGGAMLLTVICLQVILRRLDISSPTVLARIQFALAALLIIALAGFAISRSFFLAVILYWVIMILREVSSPLYTAWVNHRLDPQIRATFLSMSSQVDAFGQIAGGPLAGAVARQYTIRNGLFCSAAMLSPILCFLRRQLGCDNDQEGDGPLDDFQSE